MWTDPTAIDTLTTERAAQSVRLRPLVKDGPLVPTIVEPAGIALLASFIIRLDEVARLNAFCHYDFTGKFGVQAKAFEIASLNKSYVSVRSRPSYPRRASRLMLARDAEIYHPRC